eukprot:scaffold1553_cov22-Tisochrysis_lutea.AAC.4
MSGRAGFEPLKWRLAVQLTTEHCPATIHVLRASRAITMSAKEMESSTRQILDILVLKAPLQHQAWNLRKSGKENEPRF